MQTKSGSNNWRPVPGATTSRLQRRWLTRPGALTQGLRGLGCLTLEVLSETVCGARPEESGRLGLPSGHPLWQREVCLWVSGVACIVAQSVTPLAATQGHWQALRRLRNRPLADILYQDRAIVRSHFEFTTLSPGMPLYRLTQAKQASSTRSYARRSVFLRAGQPLLVAEAFLPAFWRLAKDS